MTRYVVIEAAGDAERAEHAIAAALAEIAPAGVRVVHDWRPAAARAVLAAVHGERLVLLAVAERDVVDQLCDDLRRLGTLDHRIGAPPASTLSPEQRALLAHLVGGATLGAAAKALHLSRRTADRRLAAARTALGARSTAEAVALAARAGISPPR